MHRMSGRHGMHACVAYGTYFDQGARPECGHSFAAGRGGGRGRGLRGRSRSPVFCPAVEAKFQRSEEQACRSVTASCGHTQKKSPSIDSRNLSYVCLVQSLCMMICFSILIFFWAIILRDRLTIPSLPPPPPLVSMHQRFYPFGGGRGGGSLCIINDSPHWRRRSTAAAPRPAAPAPGHFAPRSPVYDDDGRWVQ